MSVLTEQEKFYKVRQTIAFLNSMVNSGEKHTDSSIEFVNGGIRYIDELAKANEATNEQSNCNITCVSESTCMYCGGSVVRNCCTKCDKINF